MLLLLFEEIINIIIDIIYKDQDYATCLSLFYTNKQLQKMIYKYKITKKVMCYYAASKGHLELLKWGHEMKCPWSICLKIFNPCYIAVKNGHLNILNWIINNKPKSYLNDTCQYASQTGQLEIIKWAIKNNLPWNNDNYTYAVENDHLEILKWIIEQGYPWNKNIIKCKARFYNRLNILKWLHENGL